MVDDYKRHTLMCTPVKNVIISMCTSGYTQQEISNILSVSQLGISKLLKRHKARGSSKTNTEADCLENDVRGDRNIFRCVRLNPEANFSGHNW